MRQVSNSLDLTILVLTSSDGDGTDLCFVPVKGHAN